MRKRAMLLMHFGEEGDLGDATKEDADTVGYAKDVLSRSCNKVVAVLVTRWSDVHV